MRKFPSSLTKVTLFSKLVALFVIFGFLISAFYAGFLFNQRYGSVISTVTPTPTPIQSGPTPAVSSQTVCSVDADCVLTAANTKDACCPNLKCPNYADASTIAVNEKWLESDKKAVCGEHVMCPMIATFCARGVLEENAHYSAKCIEHVCTKVRS